MSAEQPPDSLAEGRALLENAADAYQRTLAPEEYWWLGIGLAACTLAELADKSYTAGRIEQLMDRLGYRGMHDDWFQRFLEELAGLNADGLLWPVYERTPTGPMEPTGLAVHPSFDGRAGFYVALAHLGVAAAVNRDQTETVNRLAAVIADTIEHGWNPENEPVIMAALKADGGEEPGESG